jgi:hypothetical protein
MNGAFRLKDYLNCMSQIPPLSEEDLRDALDARAHGDEWAMRLLEERFLPKVVGWVAPYRGRGIELEGLIEIGNRSLLRGIRQLRPEICIDAEDFLEATVIRELEAVVLTHP